MASSVTSHRKRWRWLLAIPLVVLAIVWLPQVILVQWGPSIFSRLLSKQLHTSVTVESITGGWLSGLDMQRLEVAESSEPQAPVLFRMEHLTLNLAAGWILLTSKPIALRIDGFNVHLRRLDDGQWNVAAFLSKLKTDNAKPSNEPSTTPALPSLLKRGIDVALSHGRLHLAHDDATYTFELSAGSQSLAEAPLQWQVALSSTAGARFTLNGQAQHLGTSKPVAGYAEVRINQLDFDVITPLLPLAPRMQPQGLVRSAHLRLDLAGAQELDVAVDLDLHRLHMLAAASTAASTVDRLQMHLQGRWQDNQWSCDSLDIEIPGGRFALHDRAWLETTAAAWRGHAAFSLDIKDLGPLGRSMQPLLPADLRLQDGLKIAGQADGAVSRDAQQALATRLSDLAASFDGSLDRVTWEGDTFSNMVTKLRLQQGVLTVAQMSANAFGGNVAVKGELPLAENTPGVGIEWRLADMPLHKILGKPLQRFMISQANGRITHDGKAYRMRSVVHMPEVRLDRKELDEREFRLTQVVFQCTTTHRWPSAQLAFDGCSIASPQMRLALNQGELALGITPQLSMQLKGELSGAFVNALVPEVPVQFPEPLRVSGPYRIRLKGNVWVGMQWDLAVRSNRFIFDQMAYSDLRTQVVKAIGRLDIADLQAKRDAGRITGSGSWRLDLKPAEGGLQLHTHQLPLHRVLVAELEGQPYLIEGIVNGQATVQSGQQGWQVTSNQQINALRLRHGSSTLAELSTGRLEGQFGRDRQDLLWVRQFEVQGENLNLTLRHGRLPLYATAQADFELDATVAAQAAWVNAGLVHTGVKGIEVLGPTQGTVQMRGKMKHALKTISGEGMLQVAKLSIQRQTLSDVDITYNLTPERLQIALGTMGHQDGKVDLQGSLGLPPRFGTPGDQLHVNLNQMPLHFTQQLRDFRQQGTATLSTRGVLDGQIRLDVTQDSQLSGALHVQMDNITRQIRQDNRVVEEIALPALQLTSDVSSAHPQEHRALDSLRLQGQDVDVELKQIALKRTPSHLDVAAALQLKIGGQVSRGLSLGFLPPSIELQDAVEMGGTAGLRIPLQGKMEPRHITYDGHVHLNSLVLEEDKSESLSAKLKLAQGRLTVAEARADLLGGEVRLNAPSYVDLQGPEHSFDLQVKADSLNLQVYGGEKLALSRVLFLLAPLFIIEPQRDSPSDMSGVLSGDMALAGSFSEEPGWSKSVNGDGSFRLEKGAIVGSTLVAGFTTKAVLLPWNTVHNAMTGLFARDGRLGSEFISLGEHAFVFGDIASPIQVRAGEVRLQPDFEVRSPEFAMVINGHSTLEGEADYLVRTDLIERLRLGSITSLPNKIPLIGKLIRYVNPFTLLEGIELEATVEGNVFQTNAEGKPDVRVETSIIGQKKKAKGDS